MRKTNEHLLSSLNIQCDSRYTDSFFQCVFCSEQLVQKLILLTLELKRKGLPDRDRSLYSSFLSDSYVISQASYPIYFRSLSQM